MSENKHTIEELNYLGKPILELSLEELREAFMNLYRMNQDWENSFESQRKLRQIVEQTKKEHGHV